MAEFQSPTPARLNDEEEVCCDRCCWCDDCAVDCSLFPYLKWINELCAWCNADATCWSTGFDSLGGLVPDVAFGDWTCAELSIDGWPAEEVEPETCRSVEKKRFDDDNDDVKSIREEMSDVKREAVRSWCTCETTELC